MAFTYSYRKELSVDVLMPDGQWLGLRDAAYALGLRAIKEQYGMVEALTHVWMNRGDRTVISFLTPVRCGDGAGYPVHHPCRKLDAANRGKRGQV